MFFEVALPALIVLEQELCRARDIHDAQYKMRQEGGKEFGCAADELTPQACYRSDKKLP